MLNTHEELELINAAQNGNGDALETLFCKYREFMKNNHEFGPDGCRSGADRRIQTDFETALADGNIYEIFTKCVETYDESRGRFSTHLAFRMRKAAHDRIRAARSAEKKMDFVYYSNDNAPGEQKESIENDSQSAFDRDTAPWVEQHDAAEQEHDDSFEFVDMMIEEYGEESIEARYIELYCSLGIDNKKHTGEICERLGCSRQTLGNIRKRIYTRFKERYDMKFVA